MINTLRGKGGGGGAFLGQPKQSPTSAVADIRANGGVGWQQPLSMPSGFTPTLAGQAKGARVPNLLHWWRPVLLPRSRAPVLYSTSALD